MPFVVRKSRLIAGIVSGAMMVVRQWWLGVLVSVVGVVAAPIVVVEHFGVSFVGASTDKRFVAVLTLVGAMVTALVSLIGMISARQSDRRLSSQRPDEEMRLRLDAAMRAGELLNRPPGSHANPESVAWGLLALTRLDRDDLAVALLIDIWDSEHQRLRAEAADGSGPHISDETAVLVPDAALSSGNPRAQLVAAGEIARAENANARRRRGGGLTRAHMDLPSLGRKPLFPTSGLHRGRRYRPLRLRPKVPKALDRGGGADGRSHVHAA